MNYLQEQAKLQKQYDEDMRRALSLRAQVLETIERIGKPVEVTDEVFPLMFPVPPDFLQMALAASQCRPVPTINEDLQRFCRENNLEYRPTRGADFSERHWFRKTNLAERMRYAFPPDTGRYILPAELIPDDWE
jgi:hypothetical protein